MKIKKLFLTLVITFVGVVLIGCTSSSKENFNFSSNKEVYGFEAMSAGFLLNNVSTQDEAPLANTEQGTLTTLKEREVTEEQIKKINEYLGIMEQMLGDEENPLNVVTIESDREGFEQKMIITTKDINFNEIEYILYYNEIIENEIDDDEEEEKDEDELESRLEGVLIVGENEFEVVGEKEIDGDEMKVSFEARIDSKNWVKIEQEVESDETEFKYIVCVDGVKNVTKISIEKENDEVKMRLTFVEDKDKTQYFFKVENENNKKVIKIKVVNKELSAVIRVYVTTNPETNEVTYEYKFVETGQSFTHKNNHCYRNGQKNKDKGPKENPKKNNIDI